MNELTIVVLTKNEEADLPRCLDALPKKYPIVVVDSGSTDRTVEIARGRGCHIIYNAWPGFFQQRNFVIDNGGIATEWILFVDADEEFPDEFFDWFEKNKSQLSYDCVFISSIWFLSGRPLKYAPGYPIYHPRLVRRGKVHFIANQFGTGETVPKSCAAKYIDIPYKHFFHNGSWFLWMKEHLFIAATIAIATHNKKISHNATLTTRAKISMVFGHSVLRVPLRFFYHYIIARGFLDGRAGFEYSLMQSWLEATIYVLRNVMKEVE